ncbi:hypothetical protein [Methanosarcina sp. 1.H.A.2.2]|nr:hypothetical protein [Methanosarcina sp. 1.H.A.2.2]
MSVMILPPGIGLEVPGSPGCLPVLCPILSDPVFRSICLARAV